MPKAHVKMTTATREAAITALYRMREQENKIYQRQIAKIKELHREIESVTKCQDTYAKIVGTLTGAILQLQGEVVDA